MEEVAGIRFSVVHPESAEARTAIERYFAELDERFAAGFDTEAGGTESDAYELVAPDGAFVVMASDDVIVGCGGVQRIDDRTGEIKRMWVHPDWRGRGLGRLLLDHLEQVAVELGRSRVVLDTNEVLTQAVAMYERAGYRPIERYNDNPYAHHWFAKDLGQPLR